MNFTNIINFTNSFIMKKQILLIAFFILTTFLLQAQTPQFQWIKGGGSQGGGWNDGSGAAMESCKWIGTDAHGNIYGMSSIFSPNTLIDTSFKSTGWGYDDFAVFSYRCDGSLRWVRYFGSAGMDYTGGLTIDQEGNTFVTGHVLNSSTKDGHYGDTTVLANPTVNRSTFVSKLDSNGHTAWLSLLGPPTASLGNRILQMESDNQGNQCVLIKFNVSGNWGSYLIPVKGYYIIKVDKNNGCTMGVTKLDFNTTDNFSPEVLYMSIDEQNHFYLNAQVGDTVFIGNHIATALTFPNGIYNSVLIKYSSNGSLLWYKELGGNAMTSSDKKLRSKPIIKNNKVYMTGYTYNNVDVYGTNVNNPYMNFSSNEIPFVVSFDKTNGNYINLNYLYLNTYARESIITVADKVYLANSALGMVWLNHNQTDTIKPYGGEYSKAYPFVVAIDTNLTQFEWGIATKVSADDTRVEALTVDNAGNIYAGGRLSDSIYNSFGSGIQSHGGSSDFFIAKISTHNNCGCTLATTFPQLVGISNNILTVKGNAVGVVDSLYWFWGDGSKTKYITQNSNISHTYSVGGNYSVILRSYNDCGVKDGTLQITGVGITEQELKYITAYPNPVSNSLTIENPYQCSMQLSIYNITGKLLYNSQSENYTTTIDMSPYEAGIYFVEMKLNDGRKAVRKIVK